MKLLEAMNIIAIGNRPKGYRVHFEHKDGKLLRSDYFPERHEVMIETEEAAWGLARMFAAATTGRCVNIYVVDDKWCPVPGYAERKIENRVKSELTAAADQGDKT